MKFILKRISSKMTALGKRIADALKRAAMRGVNVYVLIDGYGSKDLPRSMLEGLRTVGVKTLIYRPKISPWTFRRKRLRRMHRKIVTVDREIAFVGGLNIIDDTESSGVILPRFDYAVAVQGPIVRCDSPFSKAFMVNGGMEFLSQRNGFSRDTTSFNFCRGEDECGIPGAGQFPPST